MLVGDTRLDPVGSQASTFANLVPRRSLSVKGGYADRRNKPRHGEYRGLGQEEMAPTADH